MRWREDHIIRMVTEQTISIFIPVNRINKKTPADASPAGVEN
ncbi:MAG: hypothetical protein ABJA78_16060 [Ferruginibacter sp.]